MLHLLCLLLFEALDNAWIGFFTIILVGFIIIYVFTPFRIEDAQYATPSPLITAHKVGVSQGSSGTDVPAFVNEKRCKKKKETLAAIGAQRRTLSERSDAPYRSAATHPIGAQRRTLSERSDVVRTLYLGWMQTLLCLLLLRHSIMLESVSLQLFSYKFLQKKKEGSISP